MSIFSKIKDAIFGHKAEAAPVPAAEAPAIPMNDAAPASATWGETPSWLAIAPMPPVCCRIEIRSLAAMVCPPAAAIGRPDRA